MAEFDRYALARLSPGWRALHDLSQEQFRQIDKATEKAKAESGNRAVESAIVRDLSPREQGGMTLARFVMDFDSTARKAQALVGAGDFAGAEKLYGDFRAIVSDNLNDIVGFTHDRYRNSGTLGRQLAEKADAILSGGLDGLPVTAPGESQAMPFSSVVGPNAVYTKAKRASLLDLGFDETAADMYFGDDTVAKDLIRRVVNPIQGARGGGPMLDDEIQLRDLGSWLSYKDSDGVLSNLDALKDTFGSSAGSVMQKIMDTHKGVGGYARALDLMTQMGSAMRGEGESGEALASRALSAYKMVEQSVFAGLDDKTTLDTRNRLLFDSVMTKIMQEYSAREREFDPTSPALAKAIRDEYDVLAWGEALGIDVLGLTDDAGASYAKSMAQSVASAAVGQTAPGVAYAFRELRTGMSGVRGAQDPDAKYADPRAKGVDALQRVVPTTSELIGLDGMAYGFVQGASQAFADVIKDGSHSMAAALNKVLEDASAKEAMQESINAGIARFIPFASDDLVNAMSNALFVDFIESGGTSLVVESSLARLLAENDEDADLYSSGKSKLPPRLNEDDARRLRVWLAANTDRGEVSRYRRDVLTEHAKQVFPDDPAMQAVSVSKHLAQLAECDKAGGDADAMLEDFVAQGHYYVLQDIVNPDGTPGESATYRTPDGKPATQKVELAFGDWRDAYPGLDAESFGFHQQQLKARAIAEDAAETDARRVEMAAALTEARRRKKEDEAPGLSTE